MRYLSAEDMTMDDFDNSFTFKPGEVIYDAKTRLGQWATMTQRSFDFYGLGELGLGYGQRYVRNTKGELHKVAG